MSEDLELESRRKIYKGIEDNPGINFRGLLDMLDYAQGTLQYHLDWLEKNGIVDVSKDGKYTRYYPSESFEKIDQNVMNALRRKYSRRIIAYLISKGSMSTSELTECIDKSKSTISWHLSKLNEEGLVEKERKGRSVQYSLVDKDKAKYLYTIYNQSFTDKVVDELLGIWDKY